MYTDIHTFQQDLLTHKVFSSWQFIVDTQKNIDVVNFCFTTINKIIEKVTIKTVRWEQDLFSNFSEDVTVDGKTVKRIAVTTENQPTYELRVVGEKVDPWFLFDKLLRDFYQYCMNSFDSISQIANAGLLANKGKKVDAVDFQKMTGTFAQPTYREAFPKTSAWFSCVNESSEFKYIEAINNRTKHTSDISNKLSIGILGSSNTTEIGPFFRKGIQHKKRELTDQLQATIDFLSNSWESFLAAFCDEFVLNQFVDNRLHKIGGIYQQRLKDNPGKDYSYAFISAETDFASMPNAIFLLLTRDGENVMAQVSPFDTILVVEHENNNKILGRYIADEAVGDDCLYYYRKYIKDNSIHGPACLFYEMKKKPIFYRTNPFFNVITVTDDPDLIVKCQLPI